MTRRDAEAYKCDDGIAGELPEGGVMFLAKSWRGVWLPVVGGAVLLMGGGALVGARVAPLPQDLPVFAEQADLAAWRAGAEQLAPQRYAAFRHRLRELRVQFLAERLRWGPLQDRERFERAFRALADEGWALAREVGARNAVLAQELGEMLRSGERRLQRMQGTVRARGMPVKSRVLVSAAAELEEARHALDARRFEQARVLLTSADHHLQRAETYAVEKMHRYADQNLLTAWSRWVRDTVHWSRIHHAPALVVAKAEQRLWVYNDGRVVAEYPIALGYNPLPDKLYEGDGATPEGRFTVARKKGPGETTFYKALLMDYPTPEDRRQFRKAKAQGVVPAQASIGGLIEVHGRVPGTDGRTNGCISLRNEHMDALFDLVKPGTPITVVGALQHDNPIAQQVRMLRTSTPRGSE